MASPFLFLPIVRGLIKTWDGRKIAHLVPMALLVVLMLLTWQRTTLWSDKDELVEVWADEAPRSARAQIEYARSLMDAGEYARAEERLNAASKRVAKSFYFSSMQLVTQCSNRSVLPETKEDVRQVIKEYAYRPTLFYSTRTFMNISLRDVCEGLTPEYFYEVVESMLDHPELERKDTLKYAQLMYMRGRVALRLGKYDSARSSFRRSVEARDGPLKQMKIAAYLATHGYRGQALKYARQARQKVSSGTLSGRALAEAPSLEDIDGFIQTVLKEMETNESGKRGSSSKE